VAAATSSAPTTFHLYYSTDSGSSYTDLASSGKSGSKFRLNSDGALISALTSTVSSYATLPPTLASGNIEVASISGSTATWTTLSGFGSEEWSTFGVSLDGKHLVAADNGSGSGVGVAGSPDVTQGSPVVHTHSFSDAPAGTPTTRPAPSGGGGGGMGSTTYGTMVVTLPGQAAFTASITSGGYHTMNRGLEFTAKKSDNTTFFTVTLMVDPSWTSTLFDGSQHSFSNSEFTTVEVHSMVGGTTTFVGGGPVTSVTGAVQAIHPSTATLQVFGMSAPLHFNASSGSATYTSGQEIIVDIDLTPAMVINYM